MGEMLTEDRRLICTPDANKENGRFCAYQVQQSLLWTESDLINTRKHNIIAGMPPSGELFGNPDCVDKMKAERQERTVLLAACCCCYQTSQEHRPGPFIAALGGPFP